MMTVECLPLVNCLLHRTKANLYARREWNDCKRPKGISKFTCKVSCTVLVIAVWFDTGLDERLIGLTVGCRVGEFRSSKGCMCCVLPKGEYCYLIDIFKRIMSIVYWPLELAIDLK